MISSADPNPPQAATLASTATAAQADKGAPAGAPAAASRVADDAVPSAKDDAAIDRVADFYDTTPPSTPTPQRRTRATADQAHPVLGPHLVHGSASYESEGRPVMIEVLRPDDDERRPAVLILHGASGIGDGTFYRGAAEMFAERGYVTFLPHYLEASRAQSPKARKKAGREKATALTGGGQPAPDSIRAGFPQQEQVLRDAVDYIAHSPYVDSSRIGVFGLSLGGIHALTLSSRDERILAVVDMSGALRGNVMPATNHLAPTLELHGAHDPIIPASRSRALADTLKQHGVPYELKIYPDQAHFLRGKAQEDAFERSVAFFGTYLTPSDSSRAAQSGNGAD